MYSVALYRVRVRRQGTSRTAHTAGAKRNAVARKKVSKVKEQW
ncbi:hypothetical protein AWRI1631_50360 [Saccharomyces cerevisiae AWRI1631]|uniref:Uncharacterized protein n=1 Tax=Saccharomyces cerevisiae (strain AWRI1631) TaxID=545124 RepID=B5VHA1_YEAS6|nr:hypothetical protein AWRI1631_50360 [Saccharomyces cerevisiae AWRI1631]